MPIHDWSGVGGGAFHDFHQDWTIEIRRTLNRGLLPPAYSAIIELRVEGWEPDVISIQSSEPSSPGGIAVDDAPPRARQITRVETDSAVYARKANRISVRHKFGAVVAIVEVVSPGNKDSKNAIESFTSKAVDFLRNGISFLAIDLFPPTPRDPNGIDEVIWGELTDEPLEPRPADKPLTVASFAVGDGLTAYVNPVAVGDSLPDTPMFLAPGRYVNIPLETTYMASWAETPRLIRDRIAPPPAT